MFAVNTFKIEKILCLIAFGTFVIIIYAFLTFGEIARLTCSNFIDEITLFAKFDANITN